MKIHLIKDNKQACSTGYSKYNVIGGSKLKEDEYLKLPTNLRCKRCDKILLTKNAVNK